MIVGFLGLIWGRAFDGRFGTIMVGVHVLDYTMIILGSVLSLLLGDSESPLLLLLPIGRAEFFHIDPAIRATENRTNRNNDDVEYAWC